MKYFKACPQPLDICRRGRPALQTSIHRALDGGRFERVVQLAAEVTAVCPYCPHAAVHKAGAFCHQGKFDAATLIIDELLADGCGDPYAFTLKADITASEDGDEAALPWYKRAQLAAEGGHIETCNLAHTLVRLERFDEALPYAEQAFKSAPAEPEAACKYAQILGELGMRDELIELVASMDRVAWPTTSSEMVPVAYALARVGEYDRAIRWSEKVLELKADADDVDALCLSARLLLLAGTDDARALTQFEALSRVDPQGHSDSGSYIAGVYEERQMHTSQMLEDERLDHVRTRHALMELAASKLPTAKTVALALELGEGQDIEFKAELTDKGDTHRIKQEIAAFSTSNDGNIYLGIRDDGTVCGLPGIDSSKAKDELRRRITGIAGSVTPSARVKVDFMPWEGLIVARIFVQKGSAPFYRSDYVPYLRDGESSRPAKDDELDDLYRKRFGLHHSEAT